MSGQLVCRIHRNLLQGGNAASRGARREGCRHTWDDRLSAGVAGSGRTVPMPGSATWTQRCTTAISPHHLCHLQSRPGPCHCARTHPGRYPGLFRQAWSQPENGPGQRRSYAALAGTRQSYQRARIGASCRSFGVPRGATGTGTAGPGPPYAPGVLAARVIRAWVLEYANATSGVRVRHTVTACHRRSRRCRVDAGAVCLAALTARGAAASWPGLPRGLRHVRPQSIWRAGRGSRGPGRAEPGQAACPAAWPDYPGCVTT